MSRTIAIASGKGGTGKSMVAINLAASLSHAGENVVLLDMSFGMRSLELYLGMEYKALWDICDVINGVCDIDTAVLPVDSVKGMSLLPGTQKCEYPELTADSLSAIIEVLSERFSYIILDCPPGAGYPVECAIECTDLAVIVLTADYVALRDAEVIEEMLLRSGVMDRRYVINMVSSELKEKDAGISISEIDRGLRCRPLGMIPMDYNIRASLAEGVPIVAKRDSYIADNFRNMAVRLIRK